MPLFALSLILQLFAIVHVMRTGRERYWIMIILIVPLIGSAAYAIVELMPEFFCSHKGQKMRQTVSNKVNPKRQLNSLLSQVEQSPTLQNKQNLARYYLDNGEPLLAAKLIEPLLQGLYKNDVALNKLLIRAHFDLGQYSKTLVLIEQFDKANLLKDEELILLLARTQAELGNTLQALNQLESLFKASNQAEVGYWYLVFLTKDGQYATANTIKTDLLKRFKLSYCENNQKWLKKISKVSV